MLNNYFWWINVEFRPLWFCGVTVFCSFIDLSDFFAPMRQRWECCRTPKGRERRAFFASSVGRLSWRVFALLHFNGHIQYGIVWPWNSQKAPEAPDLFHNLSPTFHHFSPTFSGSEKLWQTAEAIGQAGIASRGSGSNHPGSEVPMVVVPCCSMMENKKKR